jgi:hypothetical protein
VTVVNSVLLSGGISKVRSGTVVDPRRCGKRLGEETELVSADVFRVKISDFLSVALRI